MKAAARLLLVLAALLLIGAAALHASGGPSIYGWLEGPRRSVLQILWYGAALDWGATGLAWLYVAWRGDLGHAPLVWITALIPLGAAAMLVATVGLGFIGLWLLGAAALLAMLGALGLPRR